MKCCAPEIGVRTRPLVEAVELEERRCGRRMYAGYRHA
jgi:hypothetical protein